MSEAYDICDFCHKPYFIDDGFEIVGQTMLKCSDCATPKVKTLAINHEELQKEFQIARALNAAVGLGIDIQDGNKVKSFISQYKKACKTMSDHWSAQ